MVLVHEKVNEIKVHCMPSGPTIIVNYQRLMGRFAAGFADRFAKKRLARHQPHDSIHTLHRQTDLRCFAR
jgi:hypothetical protein